MELIGGLDWLGSGAMTMIAFVFVLGIVVFVHEFGHYIVGRWCGIHAEVFSLGFGREIFGWTDSRGTRWRVGPIPLGGYVKFLGDADASSRADHAAVAQMDAERRARSFPGAAIWKRSLTVAAGPIANFLLSIVIYAGLLVYSGMTMEVPRLGPVPDVVAETTPLREGDLIRTVEGVPTPTTRQFFEELDANRDTGSIALEVERDGAVVSLTSDILHAPYVSGITPLSSASRAGIRIGDLIVAVGDTPVRNFETLTTLVQASEGNRIDVTVQRGAEQLILPMVPQMQDIMVDGEFVKRVVIGVQVGTSLSIATETPYLHEALWGGARQTWSVITLSLRGLYNIAIGVLSPQNLNGPVGIAQISGEAVEQGATSFILFIALISTGIGLINLFPIPVLDGGHLVLHGIEALTGRPPSGKWLEFAMALGLAMVLSLMVFATYNDITRFLGSLT
ncbi:MAG: RIP metalloprotease RseP [Pseudomonadota bacterium]